MANWETIRKNIKEQNIAMTGKTVVLVEGSDDKKFFTHMLAAKFGSDWEKTYIISIGHKKDNVLEILGTEPTWIGIIDSDEWDANRIDAIKDKLANLLVLPRFCIENYLIKPQEIWDALPKPKRDKIILSMDIETFSSRLLKDVEKWVRHGVLWSVVNPLWGDLRALGFNEELLDFDNAQKEDLIRAKLNAWQKHINDNINADALYKLFQERLTDVNKLSVEERLSTWVHGKKFWQDSVHTFLVSLLGQQNRDALRDDLWKGMKLPNDIDVLLEELVGKILMRSTIDRLTE